MKKAGAIFIARPTFPEAPQEVEKGPGPNHPHFWSVLI
jgi:hypothetical protein